MMSLGSMARSAALGLGMWLLAGGVAVAAAAADANGFTPIAPPAWPAQGHIVFDVLKGANGFKLGQSSHRWQHDGERYQMTTDVKTTGMTAVLYDFQYVQHSEGKVTPAGLQPERFRVEQSGKKEQTAVFDWDQRKVAISRRSKRIDADIRPGDQDVLSVWHRIATQGADAPVTALNLITNRRVTPSTIEVLRPERLSVPLGDIDTLHVRATAHTGKLTIDLWLSRQHGWVPVRILMTDDKGEVLDQQATQLEWAAPAGAR